MASNDRNQITENDIAVVGMAARLPGAPNIGRFWENLRGGVESVRFYSKEELLGGGENPNLIAHPDYVAAGAPLEGLDQFDGEFFGFSPKESAILDPQHRQFLEVSWEALENAGYPPEAFEGSIGLFGGVGMGAYFTFNLLTNPELVDSVGLFLLRHTGNDKDFLATRVSYLLDLKGPSVNVQTACSTSLVATHMAVQSLLSGECDMALAGGVTIEIPHNRGYIFKEGEVLSPTGHCHAFDHRGQGTVFGSGAGVVVLRRAEDALADNDHIHAIIKGSAVNNDGASKVGYLAPSVDGQAAAMAEAYDIAGISAREIDYVECHGTGTYMGDPIEVAGLTQAFRRTTEDTRFCRIGSVKTNIGHLDTAAGVASLIKVSLALQNQEIPASLNFETPNPNIDFENSPFVVNHELTKWPESKSRPRRAAVNSLGVGGTNAHVVVQEPPLRKASTPSKKSFQLLTLSGRTRKAVEGNAQKLADHLDLHSELELADVAWTLRKGRRAFTQRRVLAVSSREDAVSALRENDRQRVFTHTSIEGTAKLAFMMPGGGAQYAAMGKDIYETEPVFREHVDRGVALVKKRTGIDLMPLLCPPDGADLEAVEREIAELPKQLPATFIVSYAMAQLLESWGIKPDALIGHSLGENTAATLAGVFSYEDAIGLVTLRGELTGRIEGGGVTTVALAPETLGPILEDFQLDLAGINAPELCIVSGPVTELERLEARMEAEGVDATRVNVAVPAHSAMFEPILGEFGDYLRSISLSKPSLPIMSNVTGKLLTDEEAQDPDYWVRHLRGTVQFASGMNGLLEDKGCVFLECGPGRILSSMARQQAAASSNLNVIPSMRHPRHAISDEAWFLTALGRLWASGVEIDLDKLWADEARRREPLPGYAWQHSSYWIAPGEQKAAVENLSRIAKQESVEDFFYRPTWSGAPLFDEPAEERRRHTWLLFLDNQGRGHGLVTRLRQRGDEVVVVTTGDGYVQVDDHTYVISPERGRESYESLIKDLVASGRTPDRIVHMLLATDEAQVRLGISQFHTHTQYGFYGLLFLLQVIADEELPGPIHLSVFTAGALSVRGEDNPFFEKSLVSGPVRVGPREIKGLTASWVDLEMSPPASILDMVPLASLQKLVAKPRHHTQQGVTDILEMEVDQIERSGVFAWRDGQRFEQRVRGTKIGPVQKPAFRKRGCYLVTGGLGGLGLTFAEHLAKTYEARLVLTARTGLPEANTWDEWLASHGPEDRTSRRIMRIRALTAMGAEVLPAELDVTDIETFREVLNIAEDRFGRIDGVLHAAGIVNDELIQMKSQLGVEDVFGPKVHGTLVLKSVFEDRKPDFMLLFSSTSAVIAPSGQVDYVAANAFLDSFSNYVSHDGDMTVVSVQWGIWNEVGLAAETIRARLQGDTAAEKSRTAVEHPLFDAKLGVESGESRLSSLYNPASFWLLDQHRTKDGRAVVPGTGYLEIARAAVDAFGHPDPFEIRNLFFFSPLAIDDGETREVQTVLARDSDGYELQVRSRRSTAEGTGWQLHAQADLLLGGLRRPSDLKLAEIEARCTRDAKATPNGSAGPQASNLGFGRRWFNLREVAFGDGEALARLALDEAFHPELEDYRLHPALVDISTGYAMKLIEGYDPSTLWVPISYARVRYFAPMEGEVRSWVRNAADNQQTRDIATFDVTITNLAGEVLAEVEGFAIKRLDGTIEFADNEPDPAQLEMETGSSQQQLSPAEAQLLRNMEQGILPAEGIEAMERILARGQSGVVSVSSMPLEKLVLQQEQLARETTAPETARFERPDIDSDYVEPRDDVERTLVGFWEELLGVDGVGVQDSFFDLGGHSLIAVRLFAKIKAAYAVDYPLSVLFEAPTIERYAEMVKNSIGHTGDDEQPSTESTVDSSKDQKPGPRYLYLVPMHRGEGGPRRPFFLVAGMFGNVLNLVQLANLVGSDRPFYGLQARGLFGDLEPHETFEDTARDYIAEIKKVQPEGPYLIGGFSGGGLTAWEIARQLLDAGDEVAMLLLLDSVLPQRTPLRLEDRVRMKVQDVQQRGPAYVLEWGRSRVEWETRRLRQRLGMEEEAVETAPATFHNAAIEAAHYRAMASYRMPHYPGRVLLFRPRLVPTYKISEQRWINDEDRYMFHDNGFGKYCDEIEVYEMPGDHDSMVLEPNVRIMARRLKRGLERAEVEIDCAAKGIEPPSRDPRELELAKAVRGPVDFTRS